jgi:cytoskeletal protein CcmA (bactofilin family)
MFKKSEEQEWSRFRGALAKDQNATTTTPVTAENTEAAANAPAPPSGSTAASGTPNNPAYRNTTGGGDINVGIPSTRLSRSVTADGGEVESLIGERTHFEGTLKCEGAIRVLGTVHGEIQSASTIIVEDRAHVTARLTATHVTIAGEVDGQIYCNGRVEIRPTGHVTGEISAGALIIQEGAYFDGSSKMASSVSGSGGSGAASSASGSSATSGSGSSSSGSTRSGASSSSAAANESTVSRASA